MLARWYERLGPRYPLTALSLAFRVPIVLVLGVAFLALYVPMSWAEFAVLAVAAVVAQEIYGLFTRRYSRPRLESLIAWLGGARGQAAAVKAWGAAASLPYEVLRQWWRGGYPLAVGLGSWRTGTALGSSCWNARCSPCSMTSPRSSLTTWTPRR